MKQKQTKKGYKQPKSETKPDLAYEVTAIYDDSSAELELSQIGRG